MPSLTSAAPRRLAAVRGVSHLGPAAAHLLAAAHADADAALAVAGSRRSGLTEDEARARLARHGPNVLANGGGDTRVRLLVRALFNPLALLLAPLDAVSYLTGDVGAAVVISVMVVLGRPSASRRRRAPTRRRRASAP